MDSDVKGPAVPDSLETRRLLEGAGRPDDSAVGRLLERHRPELQRMVALRLDRAIARRVGASDIVQEVLLKASQRLSDYLRDPVIPFHLWLRRMARDHLIDQHRRHHVAGRRSVDRERPLGDVSFADRSSLDLAAQLRGHELTPAAELMRRELAQRLQAALGRLEDDDRDILMMRHFEQLSNADVAQVLGLSAAAAGMRHLRALRRLRSLLAEPPSHWRPS